MDGRFKTETNFSFNPNKFDIGWQSHLGGCLRKRVPPYEDQENPGTSKMSAPLGLGAAAEVSPVVAMLVDWIEWIPTVPSKYSSHF